VSYARTPGPGWPGKKHLRTIELEAWQRVIVQENPGHFARGLFHSDGYRGINRVRAHLADGDSWYEYPRYLFTNESRDSISLECHGDSHGGMPFQWQGGRPSRGWMSLQVPNTDGSGCLRGGVGDQDGGAVVGAAGFDGEADQVIGGAERVGHGAGQGEAG
jgi:hypothetical protein